MSRVLAFSVYDRAAEAYLEPFFARTKGEAIRSFDDAVNREGHQFHAHAKDYALVHIGSFDQGSAQLVGLPHGGVDVIAQAHEMLRPPEHGSQLQLPEEVE